MKKFPTRRFPAMPKSALKTPKGYKKPNVRYFKEDMQRLGEEIAQEFMDTVIDNMENNKFGYRNSHSTVMKKGSDTPLIDSGQMRDAIYRDGTLVSVEDSPRDDTSLTNKELAIVLEYGTKDRHIPARPLWRTTFKEYKPIAQKKVMDFFETQRFTGKKRKRRRKR